MYGFVCGIVEEDQVLVKPFWEEETCCGQAFL